MALFSVLTNLSAPARGSLATLHLCSLRDPKACVRKAGHAAVLSRLCLRILDTLRPQERLACNTPSRTQGTSNEPADTWNTGWPKVSAKARTTGSVEGGMEKPWFSQL